MSPIYSEAAGRYDAFLVRFAGVLERYCNAFISYFPLSLRHGLRSIGAIFQGLTFYLANECRNAGRAQSPASVSNQSSEYERQIGEHIDLLFIVQLQYLALIYKPFYCFCILLLSILKKV
jgi:hypothetical protein